MATSPLPPRPATIMSGSALMPHTVSAALIPASVLTGRGGSMMSHMPEPALRVLCTNEVLRISSQALRLQLMHHAIAHHAHCSPSQLFLLQWWAARHKQSTPQVSICTQTLLQTHRSRSCI
mmetsp:Transcript_14353/g.31036  ORF Transcript_14353/g.31036 Transcript_14353/m.31036 type:complete len:121 (-) Transcript_14353:176-538(-)